MIWIIALTTWISGLALGFTWGLRTGLDRPAFARGLLMGFTAPWRCFTRSDK